MSTRADAAVSALGAVAGAGAAFLASAAGSGADLVAPLIQYGPLGAVAAYLLWRSRERDREHARERAEAWRSLGRVADEVREGNVTLARIETVLRERRREP